MGVCSGLDRDVDVFGAPAHGGAPRAVGLGRLVAERAEAVRGQGAVTLLHRDAHGARAVPEEGESREAVLAGIEGAAGGAEGPRHRALAAGPALTGERDV